MNFKKVFKTICKLLKCLEILLHVSSMRKLEGSDCNIRQLVEDSETCNAGQFFFRDNDEYIL
jgi:hypothetical protein